MFKFIHTADIHLGGALHINNYNYNRFNDVVFNSFKNIIDAALEYSVDFILISGDLFDGRGRNIKCDKFFIEQCHRIPTIPVYIICGNHDPENEKIEAFALPQNIHFFNSNELTSHQFYKNKVLCAEIYGISYKKRSEGRKLYELYKPNTSSVYNIAMLHTALEKNNANYVPCSIEDLKKQSNIHYWALGHIHKSQIINASNPFIGYPGIPQGTDLGETDIKGCFLVQVDNNFTTQVKFINTCNVLWKKLYLNIEKNNLINVDDLLDFIVNEAEKFINHDKEYITLENELEGYCVQWIIEGETELHNILCEKEEDICNILKENLNQKFMNYNPYVYTHSISIRTTTPIKNLHELIESNSVFKELEKVYNLCLHDEKTKNDLTKLMGQIWQFETDSETVGDDKFILSDDTYKDLILEAKKLLLMKILEVGDTDEI